VEKRPACRERSRRGGALVGGPVVVSRRQGVPREHQWGPEVALGKVAVGGAHPRSGSTTRRKGAVTHRCSEAAARSEGRRQRDPAATGEREESEGPAG
jgi:hypothetical protein